MSVWLIIYLTVFRFLIVTTLNENLCEFKVDIDCKMLFIFYIIHHWKQMWNPFHCVYHSIAHYTFAISDNFMENIDIWFCYSFYYFDFLVKTVDFLMLIVNTISLSFSKFHQENTVPYSSFIVECSAFPIFYLKIKSKSPKVCGEEHLIKVGGCQVHICAKAFTAPK